MINRLFGLSLFATMTVLAVCFSPSLTLAQAGTFDQLSPGEQKIARALFEAQKTSTAANAPKPLTLDEIAAKKQGHEGWGEVFKDMKEKGLVTEKNLGQVVSNYNRRHHLSQAGASGRTHDKEGKDVAHGKGRKGSDRDDASPAAGYGNGLGRGPADGGFGHGGGRGR